MKPAGRWRGPARPSLSRQQVTDFIQGAAAGSKVPLAKELRGTLVTAVRELVNRMVELAVAGRNGIWAFILRNTYRPALLTGQFNGLVSNPPWLAMSRVANNPYRDALEVRANLYGIRPSGSSFLHLELATTHLLHAVDRYLKPNAAVACLVPGTVFNGDHHEPLRRGTFLHCDRSVPLEISEIWQVASGTFNYPGAALVGHKRATAVAMGAELVGFVARKDGLQEADLSVREISTTRSAWVLDRGGIPIGAAGMPEFPQQGADLMPRRAVCIEILHDEEPEYRVDTPHQGSPWWFTVKGAEKMKDERCPGYVAPPFDVIMEVAGTCSTTPQYGGWGTPAPRVVSQP